MSNVILVNRTKRPRRMLVLNLTKKIAAVKVTNRTTEETRQGERKKRISSKLVPDSIRIPAGGESGELPEKVLGAPEVAAAMARLELRVKRVASTTPTDLATTPVPPPPAEEDGKPKTRRRRTGNGDT